MNISKKVYESNKKVNLELKKNHFDSLDKRKQDIEDKKSFFVGSKISLRDDTKRSDILNFFQPLESKKNNEIIVQSKSKDNKDNKEEKEEKEIIDLKYYEVDENEELIEIEKKDENKRTKLIKHRENQMKYLENVKQLKILQKKQIEIRNICKFCSGFDNFNINDIEDIPCLNLQCKIFYEKISINNEIEQINYNVEEYKNDISNFFN